MTTEELKNLVEEYAERVVDDMSLKDLCIFAVDIIFHDFVNESEEYILETIQDTYPELLEDEQES